MIDIKNWLVPENIHLNLKADSELEAIYTLLEFAGESVLVIDVKKLARNVIENEMYSPLHGDCCAVILYSLTAAVSEPLMFIGQFESGFGYHSKRGNPVDIVSLVIAPPQYENQLISILLRNRKLFCTDMVGEQTRRAKTAAQVYEVILSHWYDNFS